MLHTLRLMCLTGLLAADSIIGASADKERLWNVNAEDDYLEGQ